MAISKTKKQVLVTDLSALLQNTKLVAFATYQGLSVKELQELRRAARAENVQIKVVKNRLVKVAMAASPVFKDTDTASLVGQLVYASSDSDEVMPAKVLAQFAKTHSAVKLVGGFSAEGLAIDTNGITELAKLPSKQELITQVIAQLLSPATDSVSALAGGVSGILSGLEAKASN